VRLSIGARATDNFPQSIGVSLDAAMFNAIAESTRVGRTITAARTPKRTGRTAASVQSQVSGGSTATGYFGSDSEIFEFLERGTRAHIIRPRFKQALFWPTARHPVREVRHPGTVALHTLERSGEIAGDYAKQQLDGVFREVFG
jgi:hypothetical protein